MAGNSFKQNNVTITNDNAVVRQALDVFCESLRLKPPSTWINEVLIEIQDLNETGNLSMRLEFKNSPRSSEQYILGPRRIPGDPEIEVQSLVAKENNPESVPST